MDDHELCLKLFEGLLDSAPELLQADAKYYLDFAVQHKTIIERFGRYPHRNGDPWTGEQRRGSQVPARARLFVLVELLLEAHGHEDDQDQR